MIGETSMDHILNLVELVDKGEYKSFTHVLPRHHLHIEKIRGKIIIEVEKVAPMIYGVDPKE